MIRPGVVLTAIVLGVAVPAPAQEVRVEAAFAQGRALFEDLQQSEAIAFFTQVIETLRPEARPGPLSPEEREMFLASLSYRARAGFNLGRSDLVGDDLDMAIGEAPGFVCGDRLISPGLVDQCERRREALVGRLELQITPADAEVRLDGAPLDLTAGPWLLAAGTHPIEVNRPGHQGFSGTLDVSPGPDRVTVHEIELTRVSAVLRIVTEPPGATVHVDTVPYGPTVGTETLVVPNLPPGRVAVVVTRDGFRSVRDEVDLPEARDYAVRFELERAEGELVFSDLVPGSGVSLTRRTETGSVELTVSDGRAVVPIGEYTVDVTHPVAGAFSTPVTVLDRTEAPVRVRLRPTVALLGVDGDDAAADALRRALVRVFADVDAWTFVDRSETAGWPGALGWTGDELRAQVDPLAPRPAPLDWGAAQRLADEVAPASAYLLGVVDPETPGPAVDVWVWGAAPGPPAATRLRLSLDLESPRAATMVLGASFAEPPVTARSLGMTVLDSGVADGPYVAAVVEGGPAQVAGLAPGDRLVAIDNVAVTRAADVWTALDRASSEPVAVRFTRGGADGQVDVSPARGAAVVSTGDPDLAPAAVAARLAATLDRAAYEQPEWVWRLNQAVLDLASGQTERAIEALRDVELLVPPREGIGKGTVYYWLGRAYLDAGADFAAPARRAFELAAGDPWARLVSDDGPRVAPRARARIAQLDGVGADTP